MFARLEADPPERLLWRAELRAAGFELRAVHPEPASPWAAAGQLLFQATDGLHGAELWGSDGSAAGTAASCALGPATVPGLKVAR